MNRLKLILILSFSCLFASAQDQAVKQDAFRNIFKISPLSFFSSTFQVSYERLTGSDKSLNFSAALTYKDSENEAVTGYRGEFQFRYFILQHETPRAKRKLYFAPFIFDQYTDVTEHGYYYYPYQGPGDYSYKVNSFAAGVVGGVNWTFAKRFVMDIFVGGGVRTSNAKNINTYYYNDGLMGYAYKGIFPRVGFDLGFTF